MSKYVNAADAAEKIAEKHRIRIADLCDTFGDIPAADVTPVVHGRKIEDEGIGVFYLCSLCGECLPYGANYCPNCGAKMDKEETNELDQRK